MQICLMVGTWRHLAAAITCCWLAWGGELAAEQPERLRTPSRASGSTAIALSRETTYVVSPLKPDGAVDYAAALDRDYREGVTVENNSAELFWRAVGPSHLPDDTRAWLLEQLNIASPRAQAKHFVSIVVWCKRNQCAPEHLRQQLLLAATGLWTPQALPRVSEWLDVNRESLDLIVKASRRSRFYSPFVVGSPEPQLIGATCPEVELLREVTNALLARATRRLQDGQIESAWEDIKAAHRWALLLAQGPFLYQYVAAASIEATAYGALALLAHHGQLTSTEAMQCLDELTEQRPIGSVAEKLTKCERFMFLDAAQTVARRGINPMLAIAGAARTEEHVGFERMLLQVEWNELLRMGNSWYDDLAAIAAEPSTLERHRRLADLEEHVAQWDIGIADPQQPLRERMTRHFAQMLFTLSMREPGEAMETEARSRTRYELGRIGLALAAYRHDHGSYPQGLTLLTPKYIAFIPGDPRTDGQFMYERTMSGYRLASVGVDERNGRPIWQSEDIRLADTSDAPAMIVRRRHEPDGLDQARWGWIAAIGIAAVVVALCGLVVFRRRRS